jgi:hypothetical protein
MKTFHKTVEELIGLDKTKRRSPIPLDVIPNRMGINLCSVDSISWMAQEDDQLVSVTIHFKPEPEGSVGPVNCWGVWVMRSDPTSEAWFSDEDGERWIGPELVAQGLAMGLSQVRGVNAVPWLMPQEYLNDLERLERAALDLLRTEK